MDEITTTVMDIIAQISKKDVSELNLDLKLAEDLKLKSVSRIELAALIEDKLGVEISNFEIRKPKTIGEVADLVKAGK